MTVKISVSLSTHDLAVVDAEIVSGAIASRSAALRAAIRLLEDRRSSNDYANAFAEMAAEEISAWDSTLADGLEPEEWARLA